ncbi:MAG: DUF1289 domain-containing protein [Planctomycetota bacterium]
MAAGASDSDGTLEVPSPCTHDCRLDEARAVCLGCQRTIDEIVGWRGMNDVQRRAVLERLAAEAAALRARA